MAEYTVARVASILAKNAHMMQNPMTVPIPILQIPISKKCICLLGVIL